MPEPFPKEVQGEDQNFLLRASLPEKLIYGLIRQKVFERLGTLMGEGPTFAALPKAEKAEAKRLAFKMMRIAAGEFFKEMESRFEASATSQAQE